MLTPFISSIFFFLAALLCLVSLIGGAAALILFATQLDDIKLKTWTLALVGFPYAVVTTVFLCCLVKRTTRMRYQLHKIPKNHIAVRDGEVPNRVRSYIQAEYFRAAAIAYVTQPPLVDHPGWLSIDNQSEPIFIRRALLDSVPTVDAYARLVLPNLPQVKPHTRIVEHFRTLGFTLPDLVTPIRIYDTIIEHARYSSDEPTVLEYRRALESMDIIIQGCEENRVDQSEMSSFRTAPSVSS